MPVQIYKRENKNNSIGDAILAGTQGFVQGRKMRQDQDEQALANAYRMAQTKELLRKSEALNQPAPAGYLRDPYEGKLLPDYSQMQQGMNGNPSSAGTNNPFMLVGNKPVRNPDHLNSLEQAKLDLLNKKQQDEQQRANNNEENIKTNAESMLGAVEEAKKGAKYFGPLGNLPSVIAPSSLYGEYGQRRNWEGNINKLLSQKVVDVMTQMKQASKTGATGFGQLSNKELGVLQDASTVLKKDLDPKDAVRYLDQIESIYRKGLGGANAASGGVGLPVQQNSDPLESEAQAAIAAGADPRAVQARLSQMRGQRG